MKKVIAFIVILGLSGIIIFLRFVITPILNCISGTRMGQQDRFTVSGKVIAIENSILGLNESSGQVFKVAAMNNKIKRMRVGDRVIVKKV